MLMFKGIGYTLLYANMVRTFCAVLTPDFQTDVDKMVA